MTIITKFFTLAFVCLSQAICAQTFDWVKTFGGTNADYGQCIAVDGTGNIFTTGMFRGTVDFDPGAGIFNLTSVGIDDIFISKFDASGNFLWAKRFGDSDYSVVRSIAVDNEGNVYTTGRFQGTGDFDPGTGTFNITSTIVNNLPVIDVFITKLDASGNFIWAKRLGGTGDDEVYSITVDGSANVYTTGAFEETADFDPGTGTFNLIAFGGSYDIFVSKLDVSGNFDFAVSLGGNGLDIGRSLAVDDSGNVYYTGEFQGTVDINPGGGTLNFTSNGGKDVFISKLNAFGVFVWAKQIGGTSLDEGRSIALDNSGNVYTNGIFSGTVDFDPGVGTVNLLSTGINDVFISKLDGSGNFVWAKQFDVDLFDGKSLVLDGGGNVYTTGSFTGTVDFNPGAGTSNLFSVGQEDAFISKLDASGNFIWALKLSGTGGDERGYSISVDVSSNVYTTGSFVGTADFDPGPLTSLQSSAGSTDVFVHKVSQCINSTGTDIQTACDSYTWIDGNTYSVSNNSATYTIPGGAVNGCDSIVTLDLTINNVSDISTSINGFTIIANNTNANYQWIDCNNNNTLIAGETNQNFTVPENGSYAVQITENGCIDTSECVTIIGLGLIENTFEEAINIYPNPTAGSVTLISEKYINEDVNVLISNVLGQTIFKQDYINNTPIELFIEGPAGVYFVEVSTKSKHALIKVLKE